MIAERRTPPSGKRAAPSGAPRSGTVSPNPSGPSGVSLRVGLAAGMDTTAVQPARGRPVFSLPSSGEQIGTSPRSAAALLAALAGALPASSATSPRASATAIALIVRGSDRTVSVAVASSPPNASASQAGVAWPGDGSGEPPRRKPGTRTGPAPHSRGRDGDRAPARAVRGEITAGLVEVTVESSATREGADGGFGVPGSRGSSSSVSRSTPSRTPASTWGLGIRRASRAGRGTGRCRRARDPRLRHRHARDLTPTTEACPPEPRSSSATRRRPRRCRLPSLRPSRAGTAPTRPSSRSQASARLRPHARASIPRSPIPSRRARARPRCRPSSATRRRACSRRSRVKATSSSSGARRRTRTTSAHREPRRAGITATTSSRRSERLFSP